MGMQREGEVQYMLSSPSCGGARPATRMLKFSRICGRSSGPSYSPRYFFLSILLAFCMAVSSSSCSAYAVGSNEKTMKVPSGRQGPNFGDSVTLMSVGRKKERRGHGLSRPSDKARFGAPTKGETTVVSSELAMAQAPRENKPCRARPACCFTLRSHPPEQFQRDGRKRRSISALWSHRRVQQRRAQMARHGGWPSRARLQFCQASYRYCPHLRRISDRARLTAPARSRAASHQLWKVPTVHRHAEAKGIRAPSTNRAHHPLRPRSHRAGRCLQQAARRRTRDRHSTASPPDVSTHQHRARMDGRE
ncbi:hypothetical protein AURDEDRAFT_188319 [Auricularia subglabra TFB-10046 SS5]|nr:hypothetical protein AURDEDRAFT_188319 [Auricularia subglabra TFB-10046 SS5]